MQRSRHASKALIRVDADDLWCLKALARLQFPAKFLWMDAHEDAHLAELISLRLRKEISGIDKVEAVNFPACLVRIF